MDVLEEPPKEVLKLSNNFKSLFMVDGLRQAREYDPEESDIFVVGVPKMGTTLIQHILHGLRSRGDMEFKEMSETVPLIELFFAAGKLDSAIAQPYRPNMFKSHMLYNEVPKGKAKHIIVVRNPPDAAVSRYYYFENWLFTKGQLTLEEFVEWFYLKPCPPYDIAWNSHEMNFIVQAYPHRKDEGILWLHYDDLKEDLRGCIKLISDFTGIGVGDQELLDLVKYQSSFEFMKQHKEKFDTSFGKELTKANPGMVVDDNFKHSASKVRKGVSGEGKKEISADQMESLDAKWREIVTPVCGYDTYEAMRTGINKELGRSFGNS